MKIHTAMLCVALTAVFALSACGGGDNATGNSGAGSNTEPDKPKTDADHRQDLANRMKAATEALDWAGMKALFQADEHALAEKRMSSEFKELNEKKGKVTVKSMTMEEKDGKFFVKVEQTIEVDGEKDEDDHVLSMIEVDGKWYLSFKK